MDPALLELIRRGKAVAGREVEAIIRLRRPGLNIPGVRIVSRFGRVATCRVRAEAIASVRAHPDVVSLKAPRTLGPEPDPDPVGPQPDPPEGPIALRCTDIRRPPGIHLDGSGVVVGIVDFGIDFDHANFKNPDGSTRLLALWDQRPGAAGVAPEPYGYGTLHRRADIDAALRTGAPYATLGYHPASADRGRGAHGSHVADIAAGNGAAGGPIGVAPNARLVFVHLADRDTGGLANLGDSRRVLEAVDFIARTAGPRPWVVNLSVGRHGGPHDGTTLVELAFDELLDAVPGCFMVLSGGNYYRSGTHASGVLSAGETHALRFRTDPQDLTDNELEIWYGGGDEFVVRIDAPGTGGTGPLALGEHADVVVGDRVVGHVYHRACDPNNGANHIDAFIDATAPAGIWTVRLQARRVSCGRFDAWLERDEACRGCQARFVRCDRDPHSTTGTIANGHLPLVVGAYDAHTPTGPPGAFSSAGPTTDGRCRPDVAAPGCDVLAARSAPRASPRSPGRLIRKSGSSMAAPHVTGAVALCLQAFGHRLDARQLRALVLAAAEPPAVADPDRRLGHGYLRIPRLIGAVQQSPPTPLGIGSENTMNIDPEEIAALASAPATAYRELMYRPNEKVARSICERFALVARPGQRPTRSPRPGDVLLRIDLGKPGGGEFTVLASPDLTRRRYSDENQTAGWFTVVTAADTPVERRILDTAGRVPLGHLLLRPLTAPVDEAAEETTGLSSSRLDSPVASPAEIAFMPAVYDNHVAQPSAPGYDDHGEMLFELEELARHAAYGSTGVWREGPVQLPEAAENDGRPKVLTSEQLRWAWSPYECAEDRMVLLRLFGRWSTLVNPETIDAWRAFEQALLAAGYQPHRARVFNCLQIAGQQTSSLHAYGLAIDIDDDAPACNVNRPTPDGREVRFSAADTKDERCQDVRRSVADTSFTADQIAAIEAIQTVDGHQVFTWGGRWRTNKNTMHFQINVTPTELARGIPTQSPPAQPALIAMSDNAEPTFQALTEDTQTNVILPDWLGDIEGDSADTTVGYDYQRLLLRDRNGDSGDEPSEIWGQAQRLREILDRRGDPFDADRTFLANAVRYQLQTLDLYREIKLARAAAKSNGQKQVLDLYVILFPGEGRDNTGIKDLNDKVLGYKINSEFIAKRQAAIRRVFSSVENLGPRYKTVGTDYKTASIVAYGKTREDFAGDLVELDRQLRDALLKCLKKAAEDPADDKQKAEIEKLRKTLEKNKKYKFDFLFGAFSLDPTKYPSDIETLYLLLTQALKGAGIARFVSKASTQKSRETAKIAGGTGVKIDGKKLDTRGKSFDLNAFRKTTNAADQIKTFMSTPYNRDRPYDYINILVDTVWDWAFLYYRKLWRGNPDVIRDVRKRLLVKPTAKQGLKYTFRAQVELLELWLVALNELDFVKDFLPGEFRKELVTYHDLCNAAFTELYETSDAIHWDRLEKVLTHDLRLTRDRVLVQGTASEYQFYAYAADNDQQIFFTMDVRDLGVEVILWYELSNWIIWEDKLSDIKLLEETFESTKPINQRKRATYDAVVAVMKKYFDQLVRGADGGTAALRAFETGVRTPGFVSDFKAMVQVMLGGDEVFVAAHPYFARYVTDIIRDLDKATFRSDSHGQPIGDRPLNMRVSVAYSSAKIASGGPTSVALSPAQRLENQRSHDRALRLGGTAASALKTLERTHRRIERLIELIEANPKKAKQAPEFRDRLAKLGLLQLYVQVQYAHTAALSMALYERLLAALDAGDLVTAQGFKLIDLVDFSGNIVDAQKLTSDAAKLESDVSRVVGLDNYHQDGPPVDGKTKKIIDGIIDIIVGKSPKAVAAGRP
jgi:Subtilase family/D-alanyl-D-alanine carboxypeptidase